MSTNYISNFKGKRSQIKRKIIQIICHSYTSKRAYKKVMKWKFRSLIRYLSISPTKHNHNRIISGNPELVYVYLTVNIPSLTSRPSNRPRALHASKARLFIHLKIHYTQKSNTNKYEEKRLAAQKDPIQNSTVLL